MQSKVCVVIGGVKRVLTSILPTRKDGSVMSYRETHPRRRVSSKALKTQKARLERIKRGKG